MHTYYKNGKNFTQRIRKLREHFSRHNQPQLRIKIKKLKEPVRLKTPLRHRSARLAENIGAVLVKIQASTSFTAIQHYKKQ